MSNADEPRPRSAATVKHDIFAAIRTAIVSRRLLAGTKLTEEVVAEAFRCGRGPVRWALARLQDEGLVTLVPHRGAFVAEPAVEETRNLFGARRIIECGIVRCLCGASRTTDFAPLFQCVEAEDRAQAAGDDAEARRLSGDFHLILARLTANPVVDSMLRELVSRTILAIGVHPLPGAAGCRTEEHRRLAAQLRAGDLEAASREMEQHLEAIKAGLDFSRRDDARLDLRAVLQAARTA